MEKLKQKLSSRKLWAALLSAVLCVVAAICGDELTPEVVSVIKYAVAAGIAYIFGEGIVDVARQIFGVDISAILAEVKREEEKDAAAETDADPTAES